MRSFSLLQKKRYNEHTKTNKAFIFLSSLQKPKSSVPSKGYVLVSFKGYKEYKKCIPSSKVVRWFLHNFGLTQLVFGILNFRFRKKYAKLVFLSSHRKQLVSFLLYAKLFFFQKPTHRTSFWFFFFILYGIPCWFLKGHMC